MRVGLQQTARKVFNILATSILVLNLNVKLWYNNYKGLLICNVKSVKNMMRPFI